MAYRTLFQKTGQARSAPARSRNRSRRFIDLDLDLGLTNEDVMADIDPGMLTWRENLSEQAEIVSVAA